MSMTNTHIQGTQQPQWLCNQHVRKTNNSRAARFAIQRLSRARKASLRLDVEVLLNGVQHAIQRDLNRAHGAYERVS